MGVSRFSLGQLSLTSHPGRDVQNTVEDTFLELKREMVPEVDLTLGERSRIEPGQPQPYSSNWERRRSGKWFVFITSFMKDNVGGFRQVSCVVTALRSSVRHNSGATAPSNG